MANTARTEEARHGILATLARRIRQWFKLQTPPSRLGSTGSLSQDSIMWEPRSPILPIRGGSIAPLSFIRRPSSNLRRVVPHQDLTLSQHPEPDSRISSPFLTPSRRPLPPIPTPYHYQNYQNYLNRRNLDRIRQRPLVIENPLRQDGH